MTDLVFVDTNVLIYALDPAVPEKHRAARAWREHLWDSQRGRISFQVLQEFYVKACQKWPELRQQVRDEILELVLWRPVTANAELIERAWKLQDRFQLSFWDALIVSAAKAALCRFLLTEDLQHNQDLEGVLIVNPFLQSTLP